MTPIGNSFGWGYNGYSGGGDRAEWIQETVDLSQFAGQEVWIRFEYVTDATVNGEGFLLDDIAIPALGYFSDFEENDGGWVTEGWARIQNELPQTFRLALISSGDETSVEYLDLPDLHELEIPIKRGDREITLVVTATTRFTRQEATYRFEVVP